jgi:hypothetical protein
MQTDNSLPKISYTDNNNKTTNQSYIDVSHNIVCNNLENLETEYIHTNEKVNENDKENENDNMNENENDNMNENENDNENENENDNMNENENDNMNENENDNMNENENENENENREIDGKENNEKENNEKENNEKENNEKENNEKENNEKDNNEKDNNDKDNNEKENNGNKTDGKINNNVEYIVNNNFINNDDVLSQKQAYQNLFVQDKFLSVVNPKDENTLDNIKSNTIVTQDNKLENNNNNNLIYNLNEKSPINNMIVELNTPIESQKKNVNLVNDYKDTILQMFDVCKNENIKHNYMNNENVSNIETMLSNYHIETQNKLDQILKYFQEELDQERMKRCVLEKKIESINKLIQIYENQII